jgi:tripartite-type tricarboxylate transporter receptor subunit TctC
MKFFALRALASLLPLLLSPAASSQDNYPNRPVTIVVGFQAGSGVDVQTRVFAQALGETLGSTVVIENRAGAATMIGTRYVAGASPDGYTLLATTNGSVGSVPILYKNAGYDPLRDFAGIGMMSASPFYLTVSSRSPYKSVADLLKAARDKPGQLNYGSSGVGSSGHIFMELFAQITGVKMTHVPFNSSAASLNEIMAGRIDVVFGDVNAVPLAKAGSVSILGISTKERFEGMPDARPIATEIPTFDVMGWTALVAPAKTPEAVLKKLHAATAEAVKHPKYLEFHRNVGQGNLDLAERQQVQAFFKAEVDRYRDVLQRADLVGKRD